MSMTRTSAHNLSIADSYDIWAADDHRGDGGGWMIVVFRDGFSSMLSDEHGPIVWPTETAAQGYSKRPVHRLSQRYRNVTHGRIRPTSG